MVWCGSKMMAGPLTLWPGESWGLVLAFAEFGAAANRFHRDRLDHQLFVAVDEAEPRLVGFLEGRFHLGE
jgi:hypothetical protein